MLFESAGVAEAVAAHLRSLNVANEIRAKRADWAAMAAALYPPIVGSAPMTGNERGAAIRKNRANLVQPKDENTGT